MKIYSTENPEYFMEFKDGKLDTTLLKQSILRTKDSGVKNEFKKYEDVDTVLDKLYTFSIDHAYADWVCKYLSYASKQTKDSSIPDRGYWKINKFQRLIIKKENIKKIKLLTSKDDFTGDFTSWDVETTGLNTNLDSVIQISAVKYRDDKVVDTFDKLISPSNGAELSTLITDITGITNEDLVGKPLFSDVVDEFLEFLGDDILVGHNLEFDIKMIKSELERLDLELPTIRYFDTLKLSKTHIPYLGRGGYKLENLKSRLGDSISDLQSHNSLNDSIITGRLYIHIKDLTRV